MHHVSFSTCTEACGWFAGIVAAICYGSFGVPIRGITVQVDPLVMQSYKTFVVFLTCWLILLTDIPFQFTPLGIASGLFWVPGATAGIYGIRNAGLAVAVGTWSALIVMTSFAWGILVFQEPIQNIPAAIAAALTLISGLVGMGHFSAGESSPSKNNSKSTDDLELTLVLTSVSSNDAIGVTSSPLRKPSKRRNLARTSSQEIVAEEEQEAFLDKSSTTDHQADEKNINANTNNTPSRDENDPNDIAIHFCGLALTRRQAGILGCVINGCWGGSNLIPMHYAKQQGFGGAGYIISFAIGAAIVNVGMWILRWMYGVIRTRSMFQAYQELPSFHIQTLWAPGLLAGSIYSVGKFASILSVLYLGQGVGYSLCQLSIIVSGLWGIFFYREIQGFKRVSMWFMSAAVTVVGIIGLSQQRVGGH